MRKSATSLMLVCVVATLGCPDPTADDDGNDDATSDADTTDDADTSDTTDTTTDDTDTTDDDNEDTTDDTGGECAIEFEEGVPGLSGAFILRNDRDTTVYIPQSIVDCTWEAWQILDGETPVYWNDAFVPTCTALSENDCTWGCKDGPANAIKLEPGATWTEPWDFYVWTPIDVPAGCYGGQCEAGFECWAGRAKLEGELTARLRVTESCDFGDLCECEGDACLIEADSLSIQETTTTPVDIVFDAAGIDILLAIE